MLGNFVLIISNTKHNIFPNYFPHVKPHVLFNAEVTQKQAN